MILVDTAVWIDHIASSDPTLERLLHGGEVLVHPMIVGELAMGDFRNRRAVLDGLARLPAAQVGYHDEVVGFVDRHRLHGSGIGYIDAHLLVAARLTERAKLWTRDKRLHAAAMRLGVAADNL